MCRFVWPFSIANISHSSYRYVRARPKILDPGTHCSPSGSYTTLLLRLPETPIIMKHRLNYSCLFTPVPLPSSIHNAANDGELGRKHRLPRNSLSTPSYKYNTTPRTRFAPATIVSFHPAASYPGSFTLPVFRVNMRRRSKSFCAVSPRSYSVGLLPEMGGPHFAITARRPPPFANVHWET
jgi:hypothetical protein